MDFIFKKYSYCNLPYTINFKKIRNIKNFPKEKLKLLYDPILKVNYINNKKKEKIDDRFLKTDYILSIGKLTKQKNFLY